MAFARWDPLQDFLSLHEWLTRIAAGDEAGWMPSVDVFETADRVVVTAEVAGLSREQLDIQAVDGKLVLRGERPPLAQGGRFTRVERGHGRFARAFTLPPSADVASITADLRDGVLTIEIPKVADTRTIEVQ